MRDRKGRDIYSWEPMMNKKSYEQVNIERNLRKK